MMVIVLKNYTNKRAVRFSLIADFLFYQVLHHSRCISNSYLIIWPELARTPEDQDGK